MQLSVILRTSYMLPTPVLLAPNILFQCPLLTLGTSLNDLLSIPLGRHAPSLFKAFSLPHSPPPLIQGMSAISTPLTSWRRSALPEDPSYPHWIKLSHTVVFLLCNSHSHLPWYLLGVIAIVICHVITRLMSISSLDHKLHNAHHCFLQG